MSTKIRGITIELGGDTSGLEKALQGVNKEISSTQKELKDVERLLKLDPTNTELLRQKHQLLGNQVAQTKEKLDSLKQAEKQAQDQFKKGDISEKQYNALKREVIATENQLGKLEDEAKQAERVLNGIDEEPIEDVSEAAKKAEKSLESAGKEASNFGDHLKAEAIVEGAKAIVGTLKDVAEESKEYMKIMGSLEVSSAAAGYTTEETTEIYKNLYGVLADEQSAATTVANLQAVGLSQEKLTQLTNGTIGAWATYGDSIPIDGLAEAINETVKVGKVTGTFADVLNWAGVSEDEFNAKLESCGTETERANLLLQQLSDQGLMKAGEAWKKNNSALVENNEANAELQEQMAELGETVMPVITEVTEKIANMLEWFNSLDSGTQEVILTVIALVAALGTLGSLMSFIAANPIVLLIAAIVALVTLIATKGDEIQGILQKVDDFLQGVFAKDWTEIFGPVLGESLNMFFANLKNIWNSIKMIFDGIIDFIRGVFTGDWERAWGGIKKIFAGVFNGLIAVAKMPINSIIGILNGAISGINLLIKGINKIKFDIPDWVPGLGGKKFGFNIGTIGKIPYLAKGGVLSQGSAIVGEAGPELLTMQGNQAIVQPLTNQTSKTTNFGGINMVVYGAPGQNVDELAEVISEKINDEVLRREAVYS